MNLAMQSKNQNMIHYKIKQNDVKNHYHLSGSRMLDSAVPIAPDTNELSLFAFNRSENHENLF